MVGLTEPPPSLLWRCGWVFFGRAVWLPRILDESHAGGGEDPGVLLHRRPIVGDVLEDVKTDRCVEGSVGERGGAQVCHDLNRPAVSGRVDVDTHVEALTRIRQSPSHGGGRRDLENVSRGCDLLVESGEQEGKVPVPFQRVTVRATGVLTATGTRAERFDMSSTAGTEISGRRPTRRPQLARFDGFHRGISRRPPYDGTCI